VALVAIVIGVVVFLYSSSSSTAPSSATGNNQAAVAVPFSPLVNGVHSNVQTRTNYLITSETELNKLWKMIDASGEMPNVDFNKNYVAAVFAGAKPTVGYSVQVSKVEDTADARNVTVTLINPGSNCAEKSSVTAPYTLVELPKTSLPFTHEDQVTTINCSQ